MNGPVELLTEVEQFLTVNALTPTTFGIKAAGDPNFVFDLRRGREPRRMTVERVRNYMAPEQQQAAG